jgi:hypothetical protein
MLRRGEWWFGWRWACWNVDVQGRWMDGVRDEWYGEGIEDDDVDNTMKE